MRLCFGNGFSADCGPLPRGTLHLLASSVWHSYRVKFNPLRMVGTGSVPGRHLQPLVLYVLWVSLLPPGPPTAPVEEK